MAETKYIIFALGEHKFSMKLSKINGIEHIYNIVTVPLGAEYIKGIINLRNNVIPIYDLKARFAIDSDAVVANSQILVAETHGIKLGFEVDDVLGIVPVSEENVNDIPDVVRSDDTGYLEDVIKVQLPEADREEIILSVSVDNIMTDNEFTDVSNALMETSNV